VNATTHLLDVCAELSRPENEGFKIPRTDIALKGAGERETDRSRLRMLDEIVTALQAHGLVLDVEDDTVAPARDLAAIRLDEILEAVRHETPDPRRPAPRAVPVADEAARRADEALGSSLAGRSLLDLIRPAD
jgi:hypothetical protein